MRSLREELSRRGGGSSASAASSLESDTNKAAVTSQQSNANPGSATVKVTAGVNSKTVTAAVENIVSKKKLAAAAAAAAARQSLDSQQLSNCQTSVSKEVVTAGKLGRLVPKIVSSPEIILVIYGISTSSDSLRFFRDSVFWTLKWSTFGMHVAGLELRYLGLCPFRGRFWPSVPLDFAGKCGNL